MFTSVEFMKQLLLKLGAISESNIEIFQTFTRDREVNVYIDTSSHVIFIDDFYVGEDEYRSGSYGLDRIQPTYEDRADLLRRTQDFSYLYLGKRVIDWGCGRGDFLRRIRADIEVGIGVELQENFRNLLTIEGIPCVEKLTEVKDMFDICFMFHALEHVPDPISILKDVSSHLSESGRVVVEVPHARDFLLHVMQLDSFKHFTLWSQHLVLHTRESLRLVAEAAELEVELIFGVQRYGISNHFEWLSNGRPGGHQKSLMSFEDNFLKSSYSNALSKIDANDTLIMIARKKQTQKNRQNNDES